MAKKEKKPIVAPLSSPGSTEEECSVEVCLRRDVCARLVPELLIVLRLNHQSHLIVPHQSFTEANGNSVVDGQQLPPPQNSPDPQLHSLVKQKISVGDSATRHTLLNDGSANRIDVYSLLGSSDGSEISGKRGVGASAKQRKTVAAPSSKSKGKPLAGLTSVPEGAHHIGGSELSLVPLLRNPQMEVVVALAEGSHFNTDGSLHFFVQCCDSLLFSPKCMSECRPVLVRVHGVTGLNTLMSISGSTKTESSNAAPSADSRRRLRTCISLAGGNVTVDAQSIKSAISSENNPATSSCPPQSLAAASSQDYIFFLNELGTPLDVYRQLYNAPCEVSLWQSFEMDADRTDPAPKSLCKPSEGGTEALIGSGSFSVRDFLTDDQTRFSETVQLLPSRSTVGLGGDRTCLTAGCSVSLHLDFFHPFAPLLHVDKDGQPQQPKAFLTRALVRLPYAAPWTADFLAFLLREVTALPHATQDVEYYLPPPPLLPSPPAKAVEKEKKMGGRSSASRSRGAAQSAAPGSSKKLSSSGNAHKPGKAAGRLPPREPTPEPPKPSFADALKVYSPPGLSGFEVTDGEVRLWCFEATVPEVQRLLSQLGSFLEARRGASSQVRVLFNGELFSPQRMYITYPPLVIPPAGMESASSRSGEVSGTSVALEVEPSGTGGRLHRIRLSSTIGALCRTQSHYIRQTLSDDCLQSLHSLAALLGATSMREAEVRSWMPSATLLIAIERTFGQALEKEDLFGVPVITSSETKIGADDAAESASEAASGGTAATASLMGEAAVGSLISFDGMLKAEIHRFIPAAARLRFPQLGWMVVTNTKEEVLCAFPHNTPIGLVQHHIEGQVVRCSDTTLLYVLKCACLARSITHSHNAAFERILRQRQRDEQTFVREKMARSTTGTLPPVRQAAAATGAEGSRESSQYQTKMAGTSDEVRQRTTSSSDEDEEKPDWLDSSVDKYLCTSLIPPDKTPVPPRRLRDHATARWLLSHKVQSRPVEVTASTLTELTIEELWRIYDRRAPKSVSPTSVHNDIKLPLMRF